MQWAREQRESAETGEDDHADDIVGDPLLILEWDNVAFTAHTMLNPGQTKAVLLASLVAHGG